MMMIMIMKIITTRIWIMMMMMIMMIITMRIWMMMMMMMMMIRIKMVIVHRLIEIIMMVVIMLIYRSIYVCYVMLTPGLVPRIISSIAISVSHFNSTFPRYREAIGASQKRSRACHVGILHALRYILDKTNRISD